MATGALTAGAGIVLMSLKSTHKTKMGSSHTVKLRDRARGACAKVAALAGLKVQLEIPAGGKWEGEVDSTGAAKIKIADGVRAPVNVPMVISVASVPPSIASFVRVGEVIGEITIPEQVAAAQSPPPSKKRHR
jgi:hypothetical protein